MKRATRRWKRMRDYSDSSGGVGGGTEVEEDSEKTLD